MPRINPNTGKTDEQILAESTAVAQKAAASIGGTFTQGKFDSQGNVTGGFKPGTGVTSDSSSARASVNSLNNDITTQENSFANNFDEDAFREDSKRQQDSIQAERDRQQQRFEQQQQQIDNFFKGQTDELKKKQGRQFAGLSTDLVTSGGGFLGFTASQSGALQNLRDQQKAQIDALNAKKLAAIQGARVKFEGGS